MKGNPLFLSLFLLSFLERKIDRKREGRNGERNIAKNREREERILGIRGSRADTDERKREVAEERKKQLGRRQFFLPFSGKKTEEIKRN